MRGTVALILATTTLLGVQGCAGKKTDEERLIGSWRVVQVRTNGTETRTELLAASRWTVDKNGKISTVVGDQPKAGTFQVVGPGQLDTEFGPHESLLCLFQFEDDDHLTLCFSTNPQARGRPAELTGAAGSNQILVRLVRARPGEEEPTDVEFADYNAARSKTGEAGAASQIQYNLGLIARAFRDYHDAYGKLPARALYSADGQKLLSWRVDILPFLGQMQLYKEFKLDQPWDSPHNQQLIGRMPSVYAPVASEPQVPGWTYCQVFTGPNTLFDGINRMQFADITDGLEHTLLVVEAHEAVLWTKPDDLAVPPPKEPMPPLGGQFEDVFYFALCDGTVESARRRLPSALLRGLVTPRGGESIDHRKLK
jgi:uncharacterized protein (TIGR03067 family)